MIAILVPVLGRAHQIEPLLESIAQASLLPYRVVFICSRDDEAAAACEASEADTITVSWQPDHADFARKINLAYRSSDEEWLFQGATDLVFHKGWDAHAMKVAEQGHGVIGTNDLGNPHVKRGLHSTHTFFSRTYIATFGGTYDDSGSVFSERYDHQWCDNEFVETAKVRGQFIAARRSCVEHLHPHWGKADMDSTYEKALRSSRDDQRLFGRRIGQMRRYETRARARARK